MPPAITLGAQILLGTLLGFMGLLLADSITAMIKVALERGSEREEEKAAGAG
jgi:predicted PurR-regulated permease PerM